MKKRIIIIGAGVSGLTAGIYALKSGFDVEIYEQHSISGGLCTSWKRKGYTFEGAIHWLSGTSKASPLHKIWNDTGAFDAGIKSHKDDPYLVYEYGGQKISLYRNLKQLKEELLKISPEDKKQILKLCKNVKALIALKAPLMDVRGAKVKNKNGIKFSAIIKMLPALLRYKKLVNMSTEEYAGKFKHRGLKNLFSNLVVSRGFCALSLLVTLGNFITEGEYPAGGSLAMVKRMEDKFKNSGGIIHFNCRAERVIVKDGAVKGIVINGKEIFADAVIITADTLKAIDNLLEKPLEEKWLKGIRKINSHISTFVSIGVKADLNNLPHCLYFDLKKPVEIAGIKYGQAGLYNYSNCPEYAPKGGTSITMNFVGDSYDFWSEKKKNGGYEAYKQTAAKTVSEILEEKFPEIKGNIEVIDVATPLTYERYTSSYRGAWMTVMGKGNKMKINVGKSESIKSLYFAGFRLIAPGGLPVALMTGFRAAQYVCKDFNAVFEGGVL